MRKKNVIFRGLIVFLCSYFSIYTMDGFGQEENELRETIEAQFTAISQLEMARPVCPITVHTDVPEAPAELEWDSFIYAKYGRYSRDSNGFPVMDFDSNNLLYRGLTDSKGNKTLSLRHNLLLKRFKEVHGTPVKEAKKEDISASGLFEDRRPRWFTPVLYYAREYTGDKGEIQVLEMDKALVEKGLKPPLRLLSLMDKDFLLHMKKTLFAGSKQAVFDTMFMTGPKGEIVEKRSEIKNDKVFAKIFCDYFVPKGVYGWISPVWSKFNLSVEVMVCDAKEFLKLKQTMPVFSEGKRFIN